MGRRPDLIGAHTIGENGDSIGICVVGNYDVDPLNDEIISSLQTLLTWLLFIYKIPKTMIYGHTEFASYKTCPGKNLMDWIKENR
jgi:N-acetyl-anhydromuramyl-L-alanine amidase AmpD